LPKSISKMKQRRKHQEANTWEKSTHKSFNRFTESKKIYEEGWQTYRSAVERLEKLGLDREEIAKELQRAIGRPVVFEKTPIVMEKEKEKEKEKVEKGSGGDKAPLSALLEPATYDLEMLHHMREATVFFNSKPKLGISFLRERYFVFLFEDKEDLRCAPVDLGVDEPTLKKELDGKDSTRLGDVLQSVSSKSIARFLFHQSDLLNQEVLGEFLSERNDVVKNADVIREEFFLLIDFRGACHKVTN
jgi:hypothetical protein